MRRTDSELEVEIVRLVLAEKWRVGTAARQLGVHHSVVRRVLRQVGLPLPKLHPRPSKVDAYMPFVLETLEKYPTLPASRLWHMLRERGFDGGQSRLREVVAHVRPRPKAEAYLRLSTLPGEQAQVDWAHFGTLAPTRPSATGTRSSTALPASSPSSTVSLIAPRSSSSTASPIAQRKLSNARSSAALSVAPPPTTRKPRS